MVLGVDCRVWPCAYYPADAEGQRDGRGNVCRALHHCGLLVHGFHVLCQSGRDHCTRVFQYLCRHSPQDVLPFIVAQLVGAVAAIYVGRWLLDERMVTTARRSPAELSDVHHNPSGGTSRNTLAVLRLSGQEPEISMNDPEVRAWNARTRV
jgi:hypothetical protein